ncbi:MAG: cation transporter [Gammaproteobacteria bacterium]|nr:cation transporter [Gammaproteobacteria bacterium]
MEHAALDVRDQNYQAAKRVTQLGTAADAGLTFAKIGIGILGNSAALVAEGLHSAADLLFDLVVLVGMKMARKEADEDHPYGHGKFESLATLILSLILLFVALGIVWDAAGRIQSHEALSAPATITLLVALGAMIVKEFLYQYTVRVGRRIGSKIIIANAWHHRSDAIASFAALIGIAGAIMGWPILDPIAAIGVAFFVGKVGVEIAIDSLKELTDAATAIDREVHDTIQRIINEHPEVKSAHLVKARKMGPDIMVDVHVVVDSFLTVSEGHQIADQVEKTLVRQIQDVTSVMVHVDTQDDMEAESDMREDVTRLIPSRSQLKERITGIGTLEPPLKGVHEVIPHHTPEGIVAEVFVTAEAGADMEKVRTSAWQLGRRLRETHGDLANVRLHLFLGDDLGDVVV